MDPDGFRHGEERQSEMSIEGTTPYPEEAASLYELRRWWLGLTMGDVFDKTCDLYPGKEALVGMGKRYSYMELRSLVEIMAYNLHQQGFVPGDVVLLQLPNWPEFVISYFALQKAGLIPVLLTVNHTSREIVHLADLTGPKGWVLPCHYRKTDYLDLIRQVREKSPDLEKAIVVGLGDSGEFTPFERLLEPETQATREEIRETLEGLRPNPRTICHVLPSGGTTGLPKCAPRTHNDYLCNVEYCSRAWDLTPTDRVLVGTTVGHNLALLVTVTGSVFQGATMILLDSSYPQDFCEIIQAEKISCTGLVPTLISRIANFEDLERYDLRSLKRIYVGAANSPPDLVRKVEERIGARYINAFGMVEGPLAQSRPEDSLEIRSHTIGRPCCPYDALVTLDEKGNLTPPGVEGELAAKGPGIFTGYYRNPQANRDSFTPDGFFRSGDLAVINEQGIIRITGRIKDIIIRGGENIAARDVEDVLSSHPGVEYAAVVGMSDPELGEKVCAFIKRASGHTLDRDTLLKHMADMQAPKSHFPAHVEFVDAIPLTAAGKADKISLKRQIVARLGPSGERR